jgi:hypothetical protein
MGGENVGLFTNGDVRDMFPDNRKKPSRICLMRAAVEKSATVAAE